MGMAHQRRTPEELLRCAEAEESQARRGRLKIFLGYAPRVGKSLRMFEEGLRRQQRGQDVVIGSIQERGAGELEHKIADIELVGDGTLDLPAILKRNPHMCLVDELALDNPPGRTHEKRWQDVLTLLENCINVVTAVNLQHVAEQQDAVERITGKRARNSVPEHFIRGSDEIVVVDAPPEELLPAGTHTLQRKQLSELRELALLLAAEVVDAQLQRYLDIHGLQQSWGTQERILVCITPRSNASAMLLSGRRSADRFHGQLLAVYVAQQNLSREAQEALDENLDLARKLHAEIHILESTDPIDAIAEFARAHRITQIFVGHSQRPPWAVWKPKPLEYLIDVAEGMDVRIFPQSRKS
jgi:two-component system sensor histidine kinase KdpD